MTAGTASPSTWWVRGHGWWGPVLGLLLVASAGFALAHGQAGIEPSGVVSVLASKVGLVDVAPHDRQALVDQAIIWDVRLPRVLLSVLVGAGLGVVGVVMQTLTRNQLADPYLLGISSGASLGAVLVVVAGLGAGQASLASGAFVGACVVLVMVLVLGSSHGQLRPSRTILAGVAIGQLCSALLALVIIWVSRPEATQGIQFWLAGSLAGGTWPAVAATAAALALTLAWCLASTRALDALAFGETSAAALGVHVRSLRWSMLVTTALLTAVLVSVSGSIGFVGLILPHAVRFFTGPGHRRLLPAAALAAAVFLLWADTAARTLFAPRELPVGVVTALVGVPAFVLLLYRTDEAP
ncbi:MAG TPA: iron chelate uptake ABC transporter family permease subunit [Actinomycetales bacterium]|nr:iron chelate uptake ABC transporter family permease subunit [Actinomycetales bacterium]